MQKNRDTFVIVNVNMDFTVKAPGAVQKIFKMLAEKQD